MSEQHERQLAEDFMAEQSHPRPTPHETMTAAYATSPPDRDTFRYESLARTFRESDIMEKLIAMRTENPDKYEKMDTTLRTSLAYYENAKSAHARVQKNGGYSS